MDQSLNQVWRTESAQQLNRGHPLLQFAEAGSCGRKQIRSQLLFTKLYIPCPMCSCVSTPNTNGSIHLLDVVCVIVPFLGDHVLYMLLVGICHLQTYTTRTI